VSPRRAPRSQAWDHRHPAERTHRGARRRDSLDHDRIRLPDALVLATPENSAENCSPTTIASHEPPTTAEPRKRHRRGLPPLASHHRLLTCAFTKPSPGQPGTRSAARPGAEEATRKKKPASPAVRLGVKSGKRRPKEQSRGAIGGCSCHAEGGVVRPRNGTTGSCCGHLEPKRKRSAVVVSARDVNRIASPCTGMGGEESEHGI
jgi:hypothetical protein